jgi:hypothetical protein
VEKEQVDLKIAAANLHGIMTTDKAGSPTGTTAHIAFASE